MGIEKVKNDGQVFTPDFIVKEMLDNINYNSEEIVNKHIIDNSCGDGAFLCEIVSRYVKFASLTKTKEEISEDLSTYIHGIDVDDEAIEMCISKLN
jgi:adenine-specific DNA-methyltransferase